VSDLWYIFIGRRDICISVSSLEAALHVARSYRVGNYNRGGGNLDKLLLLPPHITKNPDWRAHK
jgi:hypothetical protein